MPRYSFTGPERLTAAERAHAGVVVDALVDPTEITTGGAKGWDCTIATAALERWPEATHRIVLPGARYDEDAVRAIRLQATRLGVERFVVVHKGSEADAAKAYRRRNEDLVAYGDVLSAAVRSLKFYRSGEWMTANIARRAGVAIEWVDLAAVQRAA